MIEQLSLYNGKYPAPWLNIVDAHGNRALIKRTNVDCVIEDTEKKGKTTIVTSGGIFFELLDSFDEVLEAISLPKPPQRKPGKPKK